MKREFYHYTTKEGAAGIAESMVILQSVKSGSGAADDARFGPGVYFTTIKPTSRDFSIAWNNYDGWNRHVVLRRIREGESFCWLCLRLAACRDVARFFIGRHISNLTTFLRASLTASCNNVKPKDSLSDSRSNLHHA
jgi:hypothetical protein